MLVVENLQVNNNFVNCNKWPTDIIWTAQKLVELAQGGETGNNNLLIFSVWVWSGWTSLYHTFLHQSFDEDLIHKRAAVKEIIDKCTHMLRETANSQTDEIKSRLASISQQADVVCRLSEDRLQQLESALPLAGHYGENQLEVSAWLEEMEAEIGAQGSPGDSLEQVKKQHDNLKVSVVVQIALG